MTHPNTKTCAHVLQQPIGAYADGSPDDDGHYDFSSSVAKEAAAAVAAKESTKVADRFI